MQPIQPYDDVPGIEQDYLMMDPFGPEAGNTMSPSSWYSLDPNVGSWRHYYSPHSLQTERSLHNSQRYFTAYDPTAHGFGFLPSQQCSDYNLNQLVVDTTWHSDQDRHVRYVSPTASGASMSGSDSTMSEYALSPDLPRGSQHMPAFTPGQHVFSSPVIENSFANPYAQPTLTPPQSTPFSSSLRPCNLKDLQYTPDSHIDDDLLDERDTIKVKVQIPVEVQLAEDTSPADSGLGHSIIDSFDNSLKGDEVDAHGDQGDEDDDDDDEDIIREESDADSEFTPNRGTRRPSSSNPHHTSLRSPRRPTNNPSSSSVLGSSSRIHKRQTGKSKTKARKLSSSPTTSRATSAKTGTMPSKSFPCTFHHYGCMSVFASKNEWKRHVASQHLQLGFFRCDMGGCLPHSHSQHHNSHSQAKAKSYNDFNRKDLFTQHCRRMHAPWGSKDINTVSKRDREAFEVEMESIRARCWSVKRQAPSRAACGLCDKKFVDGKAGTGAGKAWEERMEHVGRHYERDGVEKEVEKMDDGLREWAVREGVVIKGRAGGWWLVGLEPVDADTVATMSRRSGRKMARRKIKEESSDEDEEEEEVDDEIEVRTAQQEEDDDDDDTDDDTDAEGEDE